MKYPRQYIYGRNAVTEALISQRAKKIFLSSNFSDREILPLIDKQHVPIERKENDWLSHLVAGNHQGIIAEVEEYEFMALEQLIAKSDQQTYPLIVMLDSIQDPHNFGAIIRNAEAFGAAGIIIKKDRQVSVTATVAKVASGALEYVPIAEVTNLSQTTKQLQAAGYWVIATALTDAIDYRTFDYNRKLVVIIGSEGFGIAPLLRRNSDVTVTIPMSGKVNSINAAAASAVLLAHIHANRFPQ